MSKNLITRIERLEIIAKAIPEFRATPEEELAWLDWKAKNLRIDFNKIIEKINNCPPDLEYEKLTTPHEQAEYLKRKVGKFFSRDHSERMASADARRKEMREEFILKFRVGKV